MALNVLATGIEFTPQGGSSVNLLDDYEEGTWTPNYSSTGVNSTIAYHTQTGYYIKVGGKVTCWGIISTNASTWNGTYIQLGGLPIACDANNQISGFAYQSYNFGGDTPSTLGFAATTRMYCYYRDASDGPVSPLYSADMDAGGNKNYIEFCIIYKITS